MVLVDDIVVCPKEAVPDGVEASLSELGLEIIGADFGESRAKGTEVRTTTGVVLVDREPETRTITLKLRVRPDGEVTLPEAAHRLQVIVGQLQSRREWIRRDFHSQAGFDPVLYHVTGEVGLADFGGWQVGNSPDVTLTMVCDYPAYSTQEVEAATASTTTDRQCVYTLPPSEGTAKGTRRIRVTNDGEADWRGLIWAEECETYKPEDPTAEPVYLAKNLTPQGGAAVVTVSEAEVVQHNDLTKGWVSLLSSKIAGVGHMSHRGARRLWLRVFDPTAETNEQRRAKVEAENAVRRANGEAEVAYEPIQPQLKVLWRALGSTAWEERNPTVSSPAVGDWQLIDLGECRPQSPLLGNEQWEFKVMARATNTSNTTIRVRDVYVLPTEQYAVLKAPDQSAAADQRATKTPAKGEAAAGEFSNWSNPESATKADGGYATVNLGPSKRSNFLRVSNFGFAIPADAVIVDIEPSILRRADFSSRVRDFAVYVTASTVIAFEPIHAWYSSSYWTTTATRAQYAPENAVRAGVFRPLDVNSEAFSVWLAVISGDKEVKAEVDAIDVTVYYQLGVDENRICYATRSVELRSDGAARQHQSEDVWGPLVPDGFLPYDAPGGLEGKPSRGIVIPTRGDFGVLPDSGTPNKASVEVWRRAAYQATGGPGI